MSAPFAALAAVVGCSLAFSGLDLVRKILAQRIRAMPLLFWLAAGQVPIFAAWALAQGSGPEPAYLLPGLASVVLNVFANLAFLESVRASPLSLTIPFLSLTPVFTTLLAIPVLGELPRPIQAAGIPLVVIGAFRLNLERGEGASLPAVWRAFRRERGSVLMVGVAVLWSLAMPFDKLAIASSSPSFHGLVLNAGVGAGVLLPLLLRRRGGELASLRRNLAPFGGAVLFSAIALGLQLVAIGLVWVGFVETLKRAIGSAMALALGYLFFGERVTLEKVGAIALMAVGVAMILL